MYGRYDKELIPQNLRLPIYSQDIRQVKEIDNALAMLSFFKKNVCFILYFKSERN